MSTSTALTPQKASDIVEGLVPTNMADAMRLAEMMASAKLVPQALQKSPADCLMVIQQAIRWQMDPFAVAQECSVIQGKLMYSGKLVAAVINSRGNLANRLAYDYAGEGDDRTITITGRMQNEAEPRSVTVVLRDARTQNRVWQTQPDQQLMYHGVRVWARRYVPELMLGVWSPEEEWRNIEAEPSQQAATVEAEAPPESIPSELAAKLDKITEPAASERLALAAMHGTDALQQAWKELSPAEQRTLKVAKEQYKEVARGVDEDRARAGPGSEVNQDPPEMTDPDVVTGYQDAKAGRSACLNPAIRRDGARWAKWQTGQRFFHSGTEGTP